MSSSIWEKIREYIGDSHKKIQLGDEIENREKNTIPDRMSLCDPVLDNVVTHISGISIDGWIYFLGYGSDAFYGVDEFNNIFYQEGLIFVAYDVVGGLFAMNNGKFDAEKGEIWYFAPDTLEWENLEINYFDFLAWAFQGDTDGFYKSVRWNKWNDTVLGMQKGEMILIYPFLWSEQCDINKASKKVVSCKELIQLNFEYAKKIYGHN